MENYVYSIPEVSKILKTDKGTVYKLAKTGHLRAMRLGSLKVSKYELERFLREYAGKDLNDLDNIVNLTENKIV